MCFVVCEFCVFVFVWYVVVGIWCIDDEVQLFVVVLFCKYGLVWVIVVEWCLYVELCWQFCVQFYVVVCFECIGECVFGVCFVYYCFVD